MALFKEVKKPIIKGGAAGGGDISPLRPRYVEKTAPCAAHCPHGNEIREVLVGIAQCKEYGRTPAEAFERAWKQISSKNPFPAVCGRLCQHPCETACNRKAKDGAVAIHLIERFLGDFAITHGFRSSKSNGAHEEHVAVVGAGPAGLSCAYHLARRGYQVTVFEASPKPGGMMRYGVPRSIIASDVLDAEIANVVGLGVQLRTNCTVGRDIGVDEIHRNYKAVFFAIGLQKPAQITLRRDGDGALVAGELPAELPSGPYLEAEQLEARVGNAVCPAVAQGKKVAESIDAQLRGGSVETKSSPPVIKAEKVKLEWYPAAPRHDEVAPAIQFGLTEAEVIDEAKRCMSCGMCFDCETCWMYCTNNCFVKLPKGEHYKIKLELCNGCKKCADACPCGYIELN